ncbi:hypothetical protein CCP3SC1AL1_2160004 [Gammaproteobacteria bacterium]|jgi:hypothetical protein
MKKIDFSIVVEVIGVSLATTGLAMVSVPLALVVAGVFLVWVTEKAN